VKDGNGGFRLRELDELLDYETYQNGQRELEKEKEKENQAGSLPHTSAQSKTSLSKVLDCNKGWEDGDGRNSTNPLASKPKNRNDFTPAATSEAKIPKPPQEKRTRARRAPEGGMKSNKKNAHMNLNLVQPQVKEQSSQNGQRVLAKLANFDFKMEEGHEKEKGGRKRHGSNLSVDYYEPPSSCKISSLLNSSPLLQEAAEGILPTLPLARSKFSGLKRVANKDRTRSRDRDRITLSNTSAYPSSSVCTSSLERSSYSSAGWHSVQMQRESSESYCADEYRCGASAPLPLSHYQSPNLPLLDVCNGSTTLEEAFQNKAASTYTHPEIDLSNQLVTTCSPRIRVIGGGFSLDASHALNVSLDHYGGSIFTPQRITAPLGYAPRNKKTQTAPDQGNEGREIDAVNVTSKNSHGKVFDNNGDSGTTRIRTGAETSSGLQHQQSFNEALSSWSNGINKDDTDSGDTYPSNSATDIVPGTITFRSSGDQLVCFDNHDGVQVASIELTSRKQYDDCRVGIGPEPTWKLHVKGISSNRFQDRNGMELGVRGCANITTKAMSGLALQLHDDSQQNTNQETSLLKDFHDFPQGSPLTAQGSPWENDKDLGKNKGDICIHDYALGDSSRGSNSSLHALGDTLHSDGDHREDVLTVPAIMHTLSSISITSPGKQQSSLQLPVDTPGETSAITYPYPVGDLGHGFAVDDRRAGVAARFLDDKNDRPEVDGGIANALGPDIEAHYRRPRNQNQEHAPVLKLDQHALVVPPNSNEGLVLQFKSAAFKGKPPLLQLQAAKAKRLPPHTRKFQIAASPTKPKVRQMRTGDKFRGPSRIRLLKEKHVQISNQFAKNFKNKKILGLPEVRYTGI
jgi:hypothetical protein